ncbi:MAG: 50S ribosomal protein L17 [Bacteroidales bacterium]|nr:MAG: 50S ribosomal protein L17 [Bacteroidales bacterium]
MRHRKSFNHLSRKKGHRKAMLANMASSLIIHKRIKTTTAKAKALRMFVEPLITQSKNDSTHSRRMVFSHLQNKEAVSELFREVSPKIIDRPGGYTRILKTGFRLGDNADMCIIELVDYNENLLAAKSEAAGKVGKRRRRGSKKKAIEAGQVTDTPVTAKEETAEDIETPEVKTAIDEKPEEEQKTTPEDITKTPDEEIKEDIAGEKVIADKVEEPPKEEEPPTDEVKQQEKTEEPPEEEEPPTDEVKQEEKIEEPPEEEEKQEKKKEGPPEEKEKK